MFKPQPDLDDYANNMFRFERLHDGWIDDCATYLKHVFGARIEGAVVVDYAFGRGNWSLAFLRAGALRVVAVDASRSNVERLAHYCAQEKITGIDIRCGNVLDKPIDVQADILWLYGIFPAIIDQHVFTTALLTMAKPDALVLAYGFDKHSLREFVVEHARMGTHYTTEDAFRKDSLKFTPAGRMRARDDLTAPHVEWHTAEGLARQFAPFGFNPIRQLGDFRTVMRGYSNAEFSPHHLLLARGEKSIAVGEPTRHFSGDIEILTALWDALWPHLSQDERRDLSISAFSTHFSHLDASGNPEQSVLQLYLLLFYGLRSKDVEAASVQPLAASMMQLGEQALANAPRSDGPKMEAFLIRYLQSNTIRI
ncbi:MAG: class I SAM-dependent methyltransferase [Alphaproteobacteria bacterium]|nr:class I SAM-dependent methyltransferase [Alphaproteobacteria bacterium]